VSRKNSQIHFCHPQAHVCPSQCFFSPSLGFNSKGERQLFVQPLPSPHLLLFSYHSPSQGPIFFFPGFDSQFALACMLSPLCHVSLFWLQSFFVPSVGFLILPVGPKPSLHASFIPFGICISSNVFLKKLLYGLITFSLLGEFLEVSGGIPPFYLLPSHETYFQNCVGL